jgi:hypothetical protein
MLRRRKDAFVYHILIGVKCGVLTVRLRNFGPQVPGTRAAPIPHVKGNHLARVRVHGNPDSLLMRFLLHEAAHCIRFHLKPSNQPVTVTGDGLDVEMMRQCLIAVDEKAQEPLETNPYSAANTPQGDALHQQALSQIPLVIRDAVVLAALDKLASTVVAVMVLFAVVNGTIFLVLS